MFAAFIFLPTRFWPRIDRELPFLAIAQNKKHPPEVGSRDVHLEHVCNSPSPFLIKRRGHIEFSAENMRIFVVACNYLVLVWDRVFASYSFEDLP